MIETITPDVCGSRRRRFIALVLFALGAVTAAAALGLTLGALGALVGARAAVAAVAVLAALAAARELGFVRLPVPQLRSQVPDWWRFQLPLPVWSLGYGAGLGVGVFTYQPFATFWIACAAAVVLAEPVPSAAAFALYGAGRALMVALPTLRGAEPPLAVERLARCRPLLARANALVLAAAAVALALAATPVASAGPLYLGPGSQLDPAPAGTVLAYTQRDGTGSEVVVRSSERQSVTYAGQTPSLDGNILAYATADGVRVVRWRTRDEIRRAPGAEKPALDWPWLAYRLDVYDGTKELWLANLVSGELRLVSSVGPTFDLGRPSVSAGRVAWHVAGPGGSRIGLYTIATDGRRILARSKIALLSHPSLGGERVAWVEQRQGRSYLRLRALDKKTTTTLTSSPFRDQTFWTTALAGRSAYVTAWYLVDGFAQLERYRF
jgi:cytochrome c biogenesis protein CcdA